jgi:hypothetical protein
MRRIWARLLILAHSTQARVAALSALTILGVFGLNFAFILAAHRTDFTLGGPTGAGHYGPWLVIFGAVGALLSFVSLVIIGFADRRRDLLYWPFTLLVGIIAVYLVNFSVSSVDALLHNYMPEWMILSEPEIRLYLNALFAGIGIVLCWLGSVLLFARWRNRRNIVMLYVSIVTLAIILGIVLAVLARHGII